LIKKNLFGLKTEERAARLAAYNGAASTVNQTETSADSCTHEIWLDVHIRFVKKLN